MADGEEKDGGEVARDSAAQDSGNGPEAAAEAAAPRWRERIVREIRNPRPAALIGFAVAVMIVAALWTAGRMADDAGKDPAAPHAAETSGADTTGVTP